MEDLAVAIIAAIGQLFLVVILASIRPWKYLFSRRYREQLNAEWASRSRLLFFGYIFGGFLLLAASIAVIVGLLVILLCPPKPPTATEQLKQTLKVIFSESIDHNR